jgi:hypothetical protein
MTSIRFIPTLYKDYTNIPNEYIEKTINYYEIINSNTFGIHKIVYEKLIKTLNDILLERNLIPENVIVEINQHRWKPIPENVIKQEVKRRGRPIIKGSIRQKKLLSTEPIVFKKLGRPKKEVEPVEPRPKKVIGRPVVEGSKRQAKLKEPKRPKGRPKITETTEPKPESTEPIVFKKLGRPKVKREVKLPKSNKGKRLSMRGVTDCVEIGCNKRTQNGNYKCKIHGGRTQCIVPGCSKKSAGETDNCILHGGGKRCPNCIDWIDSRCGSIKYDGYCATCFKHIFPNDARSKYVYKHTKELMVRNIINSKFEGFVHDVPLYTGNCDCTHRRRIDHRKLIGNTILAIETDEFGHRGYDQKDEELRYDDVYMIHSGKWIFIRFNPDYNVSKINITIKLDKLIETIENCIRRIEQEKNTELFEIIKLFC